MAVGEEDTVVGHAYTKNKKKLLASNQLKHVGVVPISRYKFFDILKDGVFNKHEIDLMLNILEKKEGFGDE